jgi:type II secretory pathway pseudopilin PulG
VSVHPKRRETARDERGFTMLVTVAVMFVASLLVAGALAASNGEISLTRTNLSQQKAYYAAQAGIQVYQYNLNTNVNEWLKCPKTSSWVKVPGAGEEEYKFETLHATGGKYTECLANTQASIIQSTGSANGTFRMQATGRSGGIERSIVATFDHPGFLNYVFLSNFEVEDPSTLPAKPKNCEHYYEERKAKGYLAECPPIPFIAKDNLNGPFHTNDAVSLCSAGGEEPSFGLNSSQVVEMGEGYYQNTEYFGCGGGLEMLGKYVKGGPTLLPPETDNELLETAEYKFTGRTRIELNGTTTPNTMTVTCYCKGTNKKETKTFPKNGVVYVENETSPSCTLVYSPFSFDKDYEPSAEDPCGDVYVKGTYTESLTIASAKDVIVNGNITTTSEASSVPTGKPIGAATLGLIAQDFVRVYHPVTESGVNERNNCPSAQNQSESANALTKELGGAMTDPVIDAAILSTKNSWIVDNWACGATLGSLTVWGAIAQYWRGRVTDSTVGGYPEKIYNYDERLATLQPPSFLSPTSTGGWKIERETEPPQA